jgi:PiT family inorganic phosphate transporter
MAFFFLLSGLFLGWSLGGNDGANVFGTAVGTRMLKFRTAATICAVFVALGAVISGSGTSETINQLGSIRAIAGSFMVALAAALTVFSMSRFRLPVSTSQAIVGAIVGWDLFSGFDIRPEPLTEIVIAWVASPILSAIAAIILYSILKFILNRAHIHILRLDLYTRMGLIFACAVGAYTLGANNIANVMGVFVAVNPFKNLYAGNSLILSANQQLLLLGGLAIATGVYTYSHRVIETVGRSLFRLSPESALTAVLSSTLVIFLFTSVRLEQWLLAHGLPALPLVPLSSTQAIVGAVIGIGIVKGARGIRYKILGEIALGWIITPVIAGIISFIALFFLQNVFNQNVTIN